MGKLQFFIREMTVSYATDIVSWKYEPPYDFYNNEYSEESIKEILDNPYKSIVNDKDELVGFFAQEHLHKFLKGMTMGHI